MNTTAIEWTDKTWNPVTGCTKVSQGCKNCYAERIFPRAYGIVRKFTDVHCHPDRLEQPLRWRKPARIFVNSMSDLFHEDVPMGFVMQTLAVAAIMQRHTFQILTKRPLRMLEMLTSKGVENWCWESACKILTEQNDGWREIYAESLDSEATPTWPLPNVWLGVSVENQDTLHRIDTLKDIPASVRFVSFEPLLENLGAVIMDRIDWAILGSESGPKARDYSTTWFELLVRQCEEQDVACFVKQLTLGGRKIPFEEWPGYLQVRQWPKVPSQEVSCFEESGA